MLAVLRGRLPDVRTSATGAEEIPVADQSVDVVVAAQCFHWFDAEVALPEIARVLRPGGHLAAVWNQRDERIPWVRKLGRIIGTQDHSPTRSPPSPPPTTSTRSTTPRSSTGRSSTAARCRTSCSRAPTSPCSARPSASASCPRLLALYDDYGRGMDGMQLPYQARCFRARVAERVAPPAAARASSRPCRSRSAATTRRVDTADSIPRVAAGLDDTGTLLIDFR